MILLFAIVSLTFATFFGHEVITLYSISIGFMLVQHFINNKAIHQLKQQVLAIQKNLSQKAKNQNTRTEQVTVENTEIKNTEAKKEARSSTPVINAWLDNSESITATDDVHNANKATPKNTKKEANYQSKKSIQPTENPLLKWLKNYYTQGNIMVKVGVTILFFGISFLVKFAADNNAFPIELRLAGIAVIGMVLLVLGWRLRASKTAYALILQGGALGILYLCVFSALRLYSLLPIGFAFTLLSIFTAFSAILAVVQNARSLAILAITGGFLAPILTSSGTGSHTSLFAYYLLLNLAIFAIAWFRSWRLLNLIGFVFTVIIASAWGYQLYLNEHFLSSELFLIAFYLLYVSISVLFAFKQPVALKGYVDSTLVFGVPIFGFSLQAIIVSDIEYGLAFSSLALSAFYIALTALLWKRMNTHSQLICEAFLALGIIFATLSIPFALNAQWTAVTWFLEGVAAFWVGYRQSRLLPRVLGYLLQFAGGVAFLIAQNSLHKMDLHSPFINSFFLGSLVITLSGLFIAFKLDTLNSFYKSHKFDEKMLAPIFFIWSLIWWYTAGFIEKNHHFNDLGHIVLILFTTLTALIAHHLKQRLQWDMLSYPAIGLLACFIFIFPFTVINSSPQFSAALLITWALSFYAYFHILKHYDNHPVINLGLVHGITFWLISGVIINETYWLTQIYLNFTHYWATITIPVTASLIMHLMYLKGHKLEWPVLPYQRIYQLKALKPFSFLLTIGFFILAIFDAGNAQPLTYIPILNPLDLLLIFMLFTVYEWHYKPLSFETWAQTGRYPFSLKLIGVMAFILINTIWLRTAHHYWNISYQLPTLINSQIVQLGIAILWSLCGISFMLIGAKKQNRKVWVIGAFVMAAVAVKLFIFDLAHSGSIERIASFMSVGIVLLLVGYFAPVPPAELNENDDEEKESNNSV